MLVDQLFVSLTIEAFERSTAAAARTDGTSRRMAARSSHVSDGIVPEPPRTPPSEVEPGEITSMLVPIEANAAEILAFAPSPMAVMVMTAATPMITPSVVRKLLRRLRER